MDAPNGERMTGRQDRSVIQYFDMAIIVAGSRNCTDYNDFCFWLEGLLLSDDYTDMEIVFITGKAPRGPDDMIIRWCEENDFPWVEFPADWDNTDVPNAVVRKTVRGKLYNAMAGHMRNEEMAKAATHLWVMWDGVSKGTMDMLKRGKHHHLSTCLYIVSDFDVEKEL